MTCTNAPKSRIRSLFAVAMLATLACGNEDPDGTLTVNYTLGLSNNCATLDVQRISVVLGDGSYSEEADCDPSSPIVLDSVKAGNYPMRVNAIDSMGFIVMDNLDDPSDDDNAEVVGGGSREVDAQLTTTPAEIGVKWINTFEGEPAECSFLSTVTFQVTAYENEGTLLSHDFDCVKPPGFAAVPDEERTIDGLGLDGVRIRLLDDGGDELEEVIFEFLPPGPGRTVELTITCDEVSDGTVTCVGESVVGGGTDTADPPTTGDEPTGGPESTGGDTSG
jgi:hypothetical protein